MKTNIHKPVGLLPIQQWMNANFPPETMNYEKAAVSQMCWGRDTLCFLIMKALTPEGDRPPVAVGRDEVACVHGTHTSKSVKLPVYRYDYEGVTIKVRDNFHDVCVKIWGIDDLELPRFISREFLQGYYEGMEDSTDGEIPPAIKFCVGNRDKVYAVLFWLLNTHRERSQA